MVLGDGIGFYFFVILCLIKCAPKKEIKEFILSPYICTTFLYFCTEIDEMKPENKILLKSIKAN